MHADTGNRVFLICNDAATAMHGHERASLEALARRLADLLGFQYAGEPSTTRSTGENYFVPQRTLLLDEAAALRIRSERDLFGGVVPHRFVANKTISHECWRETSRVPVGWSHQLARRMADVVLRGYSVFDAADAHDAGKCLLELGRVRVKPAHQLGGTGQHVIADAAALDAVIAQLDQTDLREHGVVLEQNLEEPTSTFSIGALRVGDIRAAYVGTQRNTCNRDGEQVYGGSDLVLIRGGLADLPHVDLPAPVRMAVMQAIAYDAAVAATFPQFFASRRNYDVIHGTDARGETVSGVLEQSWRAGGASPAEVAALHAFAADAKRQRVRASTHEIYCDAAQPPPRAEVYFDAVDNRVGRILKYCMVEDDGCTP